MADQGPDRGPLDALRLSLGTLTTVPVPAPRVVDRRTAGRAMLLAPVAALMPAALAASVAAGAGAAGLAGLPAGALAIGTLALATRGLHLDGLADTADGLAASYDRDRALQVMRTGDTGPAAVAALALVLLLQAALAGQLLAAPGVGGPVALAVAVLVSRGMLPLACLVGVPSARPQGLGATVAGTVRTVPAVLGLALLTVLATLAVGATGPAWWQAPVAVLAALGVTVVVVRRATVRFGGITGDVLGAVVELALAAALIGLTVG